MCKIEHEHNPYYSIDYNGEPHDVIDSIYEEFSFEEFQGFCLGNAIKYLTRAGRKSAETKADDARKAADYYDYLIQAVGHEIDMLEKQLEHYNAMKSKCIELAEKEN